MAVIGRRHPQQFYVTVKLGGSPKLQPVDATEGRTVRIPEESRTEDAE